MSRAADRLAEATLVRVERRAGDLGAAATQRIESRHAWYRRLSAEDRSWVSLVAQAGIANFIAWLRSGGEGPYATIDVFGAAPRELTRSISLGQTLDLVRSVVEIVENDVVGLAGSRDESVLREAVLRYSREIAFAAAHVYAQAAEERGAWDARLEALVVDAVLRGEADESLESRAAALGWGATTHVAVVAGSTPRKSDGGVRDPVAVLDGLHRSAARLGVVTLAAVHASRLVCILGEVTEPLLTAGRLSEHFGNGPIVVGPTVPHLFAAGRSARAALSGHQAAAAWPDAPRPVLADGLLAERALVGDVPARGALVDRVWRPLRSASGGALLETVAAYLEGRGGLEGAARRLFVHPNTVRYRLAKVVDLTGYDPTDPHDGYVLRLALAFGRLADSAGTTVLRAARHRPGGRQDGHPAGGAEVDDGVADGVADAGDVGVDEAGDGGPGTRREGPDDGVAAG